MTTSATPSQTRVGTRTTATDRQVRLEDRYAADDGTVLLTGVQAVVRLVLELARRDRAAGRRIGTLVSGYPGSPLAGLDLELVRQRTRLEAVDVHHVPGVNEEAAAAMVWGGRLLDYFPHSRYDGVTGIWYGKSPGVDRAGDIFRHGNLAGGSAHSALLAVVGDDPGAKSSSLPSASEGTFADLGMPVVAPASVNDVVPYGLAAVAISRATGLWLALKLVTTVCDGYSSVRLPFAAPEPAGGDDVGPIDRRTTATFLPPDNLGMERDLARYRLPTAAALADRYGLNAVVRHGPRDRVGIVATGRAYADLRQALHDLSVNDADLERLGVRVLKVGMPFPLSAELVTGFAAGLDRVIVIEEKRNLVETQIRSILYGRPNAPQICGSHDDRGEELFPSYGELDADRIATGLADYLWPGDVPPGASDRLDRIRRPATTDLVLISPRTPNYCSGCPHSRSTRAVAGEFVGGGIGCHGMAPGMSQPERQAAFLVPMGAEGAPWVGASIFSDLDHIFQNVGDGTFFHSASQSLRQAVAAGANITFKVLYNGHVAMTGGQSAAGDRGVAALTRYLEAEGVRRTIVVAEDPARHRHGERLAGNAVVYGRERYEHAVRELSGTTGVTVLLFDQQCAAEKRRDRKRGRLAASTRLVHINEEVCEGCGDCGEKSNCMSVAPVSTEFGRKTQINQATCNADYSCLDGDCPSFLTIYPGPAVDDTARAVPPVDAGDLPEPVSHVDIGRPYSIYLCGIGGTGVVTTSQVLGYAALIEGKSVTGLDQTGLAQKGGAVLSNLTIGGPDAALFANRIGAGKVDLLVALDIQTAASPANRSRYDLRTTAVVGNLTRQPIATEIRHVSVRPPETDSLRQLIARSTHASDNHWVEAGELVCEAFGDEAKVNAFMLGVASQLGLLPVASTSVEAAYALNGADPDRTIQAFRYGRLFVHDQASARRALGDAGPPPVSERGHSPVPALPEFEALAGDLPSDLRETVGLRAQRLVDYQNRRYAREYLLALTPIIAAESATIGRPGELTEAVARNLYKLMAYKDEYEVARLLTHPDAERSVRERFPGARVKYNLHPPLLRLVGMHRKLELGPIWRGPLRMLALARRLRGTLADPFGRTSVRRLERELVGWYLEIIEVLARQLSNANHADAIDIAKLPEGISGYEELKVKRAAEVRARADSRLNAFCDGGTGENTAGPPLG